MANGWRKQQLERYLLQLESALDAPRLARRDCERLFDTFLSAAGAPSPEPRLKPLFCTPPILARLAGTLQIPYSERLRHAIDRVAPRRRQQSFFRVRQLSALGSYPNVDVASDKAWYVARHARPYLITRNSPRQDEQWSYGSELSDWTRHETRLAAAISCSQWGRFTIYLSHGGVDLPAPVVAHVPAVDRIAFLVEYATLSSQVRAHFNAFEHVRARDYVTYEFGDFAPFAPLAKTFARRFLISHLVLLRTASHYLRAAMLWNTEGLTEDALARLLFALEGCLLLFQEIEGGRTDKLDRKLLRQIFTRTYDHGDGLYSFIEDATGWGGTRAQIVHPQLAVTEGWTPSLMADDYFEYAHVVRALLTYLVTGQTHEDYPLAVDGGPAG